VASKLEIDKPKQKRSFIKYNEQKLFRLNEQIRLSRKYSSYDTNRQNKNTNFCALQITWTSDQTETKQKLR